MVRKNLLKDLMDAPAATAAPAKLETKAARPQGGSDSGGRSGGPLGGAIGAVSQGIADLKARAVIELDPHRIRAGGVQDRLEHDAAEHARLMDQIRDHGQQVPVLVRPHPSEDGAYQIVYGRRRVLACRDLDIPVKALVRALDDADLIVAQGQENTARRDLSYIEKANFARQMVDQGFKRKIVCDALSIDKSEISRMLAVATRIPESTIHAIGAAPAAGRARWQKLADLIEETQTTEAEARALAYGATSDARFEALLKALTLPARRAAAAKRARNRAAAARPAPPPGGGVTLSAAGAIIGRLHEGPDDVVLTLEDPDGFGRWLVGALPALYGTWAEAGGGEALRLARQLAAEKAGNGPEET